MDVQCAPVRSQRCHWNVAPAEAVPVSLAPTLAMPVTVGGPDDAVVVVVVVADVVVVVVVVVVVDDAPATTAVAMLSTTCETDPAVACTRATSVWPASGDVAVYAAFAAPAMAVQARPLVLQRSHS